MEEAVRKPISSREEAKMFVAENFKDPIETLWLSDSLIDSILYTL